MIEPTVVPNAEADCPFCGIVSVHEPYDPLNPPSQISPDLTTPQSFVVLSTPLLIAFLDILPLSRGHVLLCPRAHRSKITDVEACEARDLGYYLRVVSLALSRTTGVPDWNIIQNNGAAAAQVVPHTHFHLIPRPEIRASGRHSESFTMFGRGVREELDEEDAVPMAAKLREQIAIVLKEEAEKEKSGQAATNDQKPKIRTRL
jgi:diadenosine tetraphosphate (Ap4A) HIT family hydrolase